MDMSINSSAILFEHCRQKLGQRSLGALGAVSFATVHLGKNQKSTRKNQQSNNNKKPLTKQDPSRLIKSSCHV